VGGFGFVIAMTVGMGIGAVCSIGLIFIAPPAGVASLLLFLGMIWLMWWPFLRYG
jgi:hypothetical protein